MLCSTIPVSVIGVRFAMGAEPFWTPSQYSTIYPTGTTTFRDAELDSSCGGHALRERHLWHRCVAQLHSEGNTVGRYQLCLLRF